MIVDSRKIVSFAFNFGEEIVSLSWIEATEINVISMQIAKIALTPELAVKGNCYLKKTSRSEQSRLFFS